MNIAGMIKREDFFNILQNTLTYYYRDIKNKDVAVSYSPFDGCEALCIYPFLGFISRRIVPRGARTYLYSEYNIRNSKLKYLIGKLLVFAATHSFGLGAKYKIYITRDLLGKNEFILPQNRSIRIFDYDSMTVDCVVKHGFSNKYFANQINFRRDYSYDFVIKTLESGERYFKERIMLGNPLARVANNENYDRAQKQAVKYIDTLTTDTLHYVSVDEYAIPLIGRLREKMLEAQENKQFSAFEIFHSIINYLEEYFSDKHFQIPVSMSHGDLQSGNIWLEKNGEVKIYDWETAAERSVWYDRATLLYSTRRAGGLEAFCDETDMTQVVKDNGTDAGEKDIKNIVILEDLAFYLDDVSELPLDFGTSIFDAYCNRLAKILEKEISCG